jgi:hypothetical protein
MLQTQKVSLRSSYEKEVVLGVVLGCMIKM